MTQRKKLFTILASLSLCALLAFNSTYTPMGVEAKSERETKFIKSQEEKEYNQSSDPRESSLTVGAVDKNNNIISSFAYGAKSVDAAASGGDISTQAKNTYTERDDFLADSIAINAIGQAQKSAIQSNVLVQKGTVSQSVYNDVYLKANTLYSAGTVHQYETTSSAFSLPANTVTGQLSTVMEGNTITNVATFNPASINGGIIQDVSLTEPGPAANAKTWKFVKTGASNQWHGWEGNYNGIFNCNAGEYWTISGYYKTNNAAGITSLHAGYFSKEGWAESYRTTLVSSSLEIIPDGKWHYFYCTVRADEAMTNPIIFDGPSWNYSNSPGVLYINGLQWIKTSSPVEYVSGTKSTNSLRVKSTGKNLFDVMTDNYFLTYEDGTRISKERPSSKYEYSLKNNQLVIASYDSSNWTWISKVINLEKNTDYYISKISGGTVFRVVGFNSLNEGAVGTVLNSWGGAFNSGNFEYYVISILDVGNWQIQIEKGTLPTAFEPYTESVSYLPSGIELHNLNNTVKDEFDSKNALFIKRTQKVTLDNIKWEGFTNTQFSAITYASAPNWVNLNNAIAGTTNMIASNNDFMFNSTLYFYDNDKPQVAITASNGRLWVAIPKGKIGGSTGYSDDLNGFVKYLADNKTSIIYQLKQPQVYKVNAAPLISYPNGTVFVEPAVKNTATYTSAGITVKNKELPVKFVESVYKYEDDLMLPIDMNKVHITSNGLSFTIDGAKSGETYEYVYQYDKSLTTLPTVKYSVPTDNESQIVGNTEMIKVLMQEIEQLKQELNSIKADRTVQYEYDSNGRLVRRQKN